MATRGDSMAGLPFKPPSNLYLITGAAGMIGSCVVRALNDLGVENLLLVDDLKSGEKWKNLVGKRFVDLISRGSLFDWLKSRGDEVEAIIHLGACSDTTEQDADYLLENNFHYTIRLAEWALKQNKRMIYASSAATYGDGKLGFVDDEERLEELKPLNMYGYSKHLVDLWMKREKVLDRVVGLKYFNVFGPNEYHKAHMASMIFKMASVAQKGEPISLFRSTDPSHFLDGEQQRDFLYVKDAARKTVLFLHPEYAHVSGIFNMGRGAAVTWNHLAESLFRALKRPAQIKYVEMPKHLQLQYQNYTCADMRKFHKIFSKDLPFSSLEESVEEYVGTYLMEQTRW